MKDYLSRFRSKFRRNLRDLFILAAFIAFVSSLYFFVLLKPSNDRDWEVGFERLPKVEINGNTIKISEIKDSVFLENNQSEIRYLERSFDLNKLERTWFVVEPFVVKPFTNFEGVAHTYFVFDFTDQDPIVVSVEARREKGEKYDSWWGALNQYELIYTWGTEQNQTVRRVILENNKLFMYPLNISRENGQKLFLQMAKTTDDLETTPRFYNTFLSNCTNELAKNANAAVPNTIPENRALYFPGYSDEELYKLNLLPQNLPLEELSQKVNITEDTKTLAKDKNFSKKLRETLKSRLGM
jgi:hypothetical protein